MNMITHLKERLFCRILEKRRRANPFDAQSAELFTPPKDADEFHNNSYYFSCHDMAGNSLLLRHAQRGQKSTEVWLAYKDAKGNTYINEQQLYIGEAPPSAVVCKEVSKAWDFSYIGNLKNMQSGKTVSAKITGEFLATADIFDFGYHLDSRVIAKSIAKEKWSKAFFAALKENNQVHYEQPGKVSAFITIGTKTTNLNMPAMRDHSYGKRDWNYMNKHFWLMAIFEDESHLNANMVSYPAVKRLETGYLVETHTVGVEQAELDTKMPTLGVPQEFSYRAKLLSGKSIVVNCKCEAVFEFPFGGYTIYEGIGAFDLAGKKGRGVLEFGYNDDKKRVVAP